MVSLCYTLYIQEKLLLCSSYKLSISMIKTDKSLEEKERSKVTSAGKQQHASPILWAGDSLSCLFQNSFDKRTFRKSEKQVLPISILAGRVSSSEEAWLQSLLSVQGKEWNIALATVLIFVLLFHCLKEIRYDLCSSHCKPVFKLVQEKMCGMGPGLFLLCVCVCTCLWNIWFLLIITCIKLNLSASVHTLQAWGY